jgi:hypothetical protein
VPPSHSWESNEQPGGPCNKEIVLLTGLTRVDSFRAALLAMEADMAHVSRNLFPVQLHSDRWLMQTLLEHSSSDQAREAAAAWLAAYDTALALRSAPADAHIHADTAYRVAATRAGLPVAERRAA